MSAPSDAGTVRGSATPGFALSAPLAAAALLLTLACGRDSRSSERMPAPPRLQGVTRAYLHARREDARGRGRDSVVEITDTARIGQLVRFINARRDGWRAPARSWWPWDPYRKSANWVEFQGPGGPVGYGEATTDLGLAAVGADGDVLAVRPGSVEEELELAKMLGVNIVLMQTRPTSRPDSAP